jgi:Glycosyl transferase family 11
MRQVTIYLMGGLGNNLFQINFGYLLQKQGVTVRFNTYLLKKSYAVNRLLGWSHHGSETVLNELQVLKTFTTSSKFSIRIPLAAVSRLIGRSVFGTIYHGHFVPELSSRHPKHIFGYFHNTRNIDASLLTILHERTAWLAEEHDTIRKVLARIASCRSAVAHIRGGDYNGLSEFRLDNSYYQRALEVIGHDVEKVFVITNDARHAGEVLRDIPHEMVSTGNGLADFIILARCRVKLLANSTYSWWAGELSESEATIIEAKDYFPWMEWSPRSSKRRLKIDR